LGILPAAKAMNLVCPGCQGRYDRHTSIALMMKIKRVIETIRSQEFKEMVFAMGGYDVSQTGEELNE
jgi:hypothetical protein